jgi:hypothetical protein
MRACPPTGKQHSTSALSLAHAKLSSVWGGTTMMSPVSAWLVSPPNTTRTRPESTTKISSRVSVWGSVCGPRVSRTRQTLVSLEPRLGVASE